MDLQLFSDRFKVLDIIKDFAENCGDYDQILKGGLALSYLYGDNQPSARATVDIDYNFQEEKIWEEFKNNSCIIATNNSKLNLIYELKKAKVNPNGESLYITWTNKDETSKGKFKIDMNYGDYCKSTKKLNLNIYAPEMILTDKICVLCSPNIRRRVKDLYDIYLVASHETFELKDLLFEMKTKLNSRSFKLGKLSLLNYLFLSEIEFAYKKLRLMDMPPFEEICLKVLKFVLPLLDLKSHQNISWNPKTFSWTNNTFESSRLQTDITGILYAETASGYLELSSFPPYPILLQNPLIDLDMGIVKFIKKDFSASYINELNDDLFITTKERTIVDLLDGEFKILAESIEEYLDEYGDMDKLLDVAKFYHKEYELKEILKEIDEYNNRIF